jgi:hypothetical protein
MFSRETAPVRHGAQYATYAGHLCATRSRTRSPTIPWEPKSGNASMSKILVLYYSVYGHIEMMAAAVAEGARAVQGTY